VIPLVALTSLALAVLIDRRWIAGAVLALALLGLNLVRMALRETIRHGIHRGPTFALFLALGKYAEMVGLLSYWRNRRKGRPPSLIEYKRL
jgi:hypothetical protein